MIYCGFAAGTGGQETDFTPQAPPPSPPIEFRTAPRIPQNPSPGPLTPSILYSIGQPTDEEQLYLEYINRSRANPTAEGARLAATTDANVLAAYSSFGVDLTLMQSEFSTNPAVPPLAMNAKLLASARYQSGDMFTNQYQGHTSTNGMTFDQRITAQGYNWQTVGENVFAYSLSVFYGHVGFNVDWGAGPGGMQNPPGHRNNIHSTYFREVGVGVVDGTNGTVGPQLVTQDFGLQQSAVPFVAGVVYYDLNTNNFYDVGEGIGGVTVTVSGSSYYAVTANSGGFTVPVSTNGNYTVTFSGPGLTATQRVAAVSSQKNVKMDWTPLYAPPVISGPNPAYVNQTNLYTFTAVGAATNYHWKQIPLSPYSAVEGAENGLTNVTVVTSVGYSVLASDVEASGSYSFHLAQPSATAQYLTLNPLLRPSAASQLSFAKRLGWAGPAQVARAQVSTNSGGSWQDLWAQTGTSTSGDATFSTITVSLAACASQVTQVRFVYDFIGGTYYPQTTTGVGLYLDNISISGADQVGAPGTNNAAGLALAFFPTNTGDFLLQARAQLPGRTLNWGPVLRVTVTNPPPSIIAGSPKYLTTQFQLDFTVANYRSGMTFQLWKAATLTNGWTQDTSAVLQTLIANSKFRFTTPTAGAPRMFYRVKGM